MWVPLKEKEKKIKIKKEWEDEQTGESMEERGREILNFFLSSFLSQIYGNLTVGFRRAKDEKCSTRRGLRVGTKNTGFHQEFR